MLDILYSTFTQRHCRRAGHSVLYIHIETMSSCWAFCTLHSQRHCRHAGHSVLYIHTETLSSCLTFCTLHSHRDTVVVLDILYSTFTQSHCRHAGHSPTLHSHRVMLDILYSTFTQSHAGHSVLYILTETLSSCWTFCTLHSELQIRGVFS
ncbi:hypothetical protein DPMN_031584 [Dreissena polymorpha]|uniref:Uncharacterized protein n=1 Tax=Dreissena polymorpha TaxID=45954 RepID=A0A9D4M3E1_DREPO|nr:hypothetical protein DPMN_031584 [Dreissena polymorpha]